MANKNPILKEIGPDLEVLRIVDLGGKENALAADDWLVQVTPSWRACTWGFES